MTASIPVLTQCEPLRVSVLPDQSTSRTPIHMAVGGEIVAMTADEARALAGALLTAAAFEPSKQLRRSTRVDDRMRDG